MKCKCCILRSPTRIVPRSSVAGQDQFFMSQYSDHMESTEVLCNPSLFLTADVVERFLLITSRFSWKWRAVDRDSKTDAKSERPWVQCRYVGQGLVFCTWCKNEPIRCRHSRSALNFLSLLSHCLQSSFTSLRTSSWMAVCTGQAVSLYTKKNFKGSCRSAIYCNHKTFRVAYPQANYNTQSEIQSSRNSSKQIF